LINGAEGIGTGWKTSIPKFNPLHVADHVEAAIRGDAPPSALTPWYAGFRGVIEPDARGVEIGMISHGIVEVSHEGEVQDKYRWNTKVPS
jgi:hypothetical protein